MSADAYPATPSTTATRHRDRMDYDRQAVHAVLDEALVCHVGFVVDGAPVVLPQLHVRVGEELFLHGSTGARALRSAGDVGLAVCVTATLVDGLVLARAAFHHSINYRSVVVHGVATVVSAPAEKGRALTALVGAVAPGRPDHVRGPTPRELAATTVLRLPIEQCSLKVRSGPPVDDAADLDSPYWAGVLPLSTEAGVPQPAPDLRGAPLVPEHVRHWRRRSR